MNSKEKGNIAVGEAIAYFTKQGHTVSIPLNDSQEYDLIVDIDGFLNKVQIKYTSQTTTSGKFSVGLRSVSGSSRKVYKTVVDSDIDYIFILTSSGSRYLLPIVDIVATNAITLNENYTKYIV
jgi:hypothetical protein